MQQQVGRARAVAGAVLIAIVAAGCGGGAEEAASATTDVTITTTTTMAGKQTTTGPTTGTSSSPAAEKTSDVREPVTPRPAPTPAPSQRIELPDTPNAWMHVHDALVPGVQFVNLDSDISCSTGWIVSGPDGRTFVLTAGHCGQVGDIVSLMDEYGRFTDVGEYVESEIAEAGGVDHGLIEIFDDAPYSSTPPTSIPIVGYADADWLQENRPQICRIGFVTPENCGEFISTDGVTVRWGSASWDGDSGGPVFAVVDGEGYAVAVQSYRIAEDPNQTGGSLIMPAIDKWGLEMHN